MLAHYSGQICIVKISASCPMEQSFYMFRVYRLLYIHFEQCKLILSPQCIFLLTKYLNRVPPTWTNKEREQIAAIKPPPLPQKKISSFNFIIIYNFTYIKNDSFDILIFIKFKKILVCCFNVYGNFYTKKTGM